MNGYRGDPCGGDCMADNGCHGYRECEGCGQRFCRFDLDDRDLCPRCAEKREEYDDDEDGDEEADGEGGEK